ncbi:DUF2550 domain-containing protein [Corynebacterium uropygiale]|uniref:DUF2550 domain-containing protein n=1 Tax=Corynebacterium uropygiale TaxID=1775911 RepID=A0A9X1TY69_9CORY|nr:DUF2550 domain-containing protein [Corynebacterium uropygiale]MCF4006965.1 DUF2550 domain-containing protein [Corynebacterium uropygiale]
MDILMWLIVLVVLVLCGLGMWRFFMLRSQGSTVVLRRMPAEGVHGWRHGIINYRADHLSYYKLRSLSPVADLVVHRSDVSVSGHRPMAEAEASFLPEGMHILQLSVNGQDYEMAAQPEAEMALTAWVESAPSARQERLDRKYWRKHLGS